MSNLTERASCLRTNWVAASGGECKRGIVCVTLVREVHSNVACGVRVVIPSGQSDRVGSDGCFVVHEIIITNGNEEGSGWTFRFLWWMTGPLILMAAVLVSF